MISYIWWIPPVLVFVLGMWWAIWVVDDGSHYPAFTAVIMLTMFSFFLCIGAR